MVFDLRRALLKKEEVESARLMDFAFRVRARTMRLMAAELALNPDELATRIALQPDDAIVESLCAETGKPLEALLATYRGCIASARVQLVEELGDPTPHRLG